MESDIFHDRFYGAFIKADQWKSREKAISSNWKLSLLAKYVLTTYSLTSHNIWCEEAIKRLSYYILSGVMKQTAYEFIKTCIFRVSAFSLEFFCSVRTFHLELLD